MFPKYPQIGMRRRFASLFVLRCRVLQSSGQHPFLGEQVQGKCWNAIKQPWLVFSCHCHVKAFVKLQMCLRACSSTCQVEDIAQQFYVSEEVKASIEDHREIVLKAERLKKSCPVLQLNFKCSNMSQTHDISRQLNALTHWANPSKLNDSMSRIVKGPIFIYFYHMPTWMHPLELASCTWYSLCCYSTLHRMHVSHDVSCKTISLVQISQPLIRKSAVKHFLLSWITHIYSTQLINLIKVNLGKGNVEILWDQPTPLDVSGKLRRSKTDLSNLSIPGFSMFLGSFASVSLVHCFERMAVWVRLWNRLNSRYETGMLTWIIKIPVVPHKAVAEVSRRGKL